MILILVSAGQFCSILIGTNVKSNENTFWIIISSRLLVHSVLSLTVIASQKWRAFVAAWISSSSWAINQRQRGAKATSTLALQRRCCEQQSPFQFTRPPKSKLKSRPVCFFLRPQNATSRGPLFGERQRLWRPGAPDDFVKTRIKSWWGASGVNQGFFSLAGLIVGEWSSWNKVWNLPRPSLHYVILFQATSCRNSGKKSGVE